MERNTESRFKGAVWHEYFNCPVKRKDPQLSSILQEAIKYYKLNYPFLPCKQAVCKAYEELEIPHYFGTVDKVKLKKMYLESRRRELPTLERVKRKASLTKTPSSSKTPISLIKTRSSSQKYTPYQKRIQQTEKNGTGAYKPRKSVTFQEGVQIIDISPNPRKASAPNTPLRKIASEPRSLFPAVNVEKQKSPRKIQTQQEKTTVDENCNVVATEKDTCIIKPPTTNEISTVDPLSWVDSARDPVQDSVLENFEVSDDSDNDTSQTELVVMEKLVSVVCKDKSSSDHIPKVQSHLSNDKSSQEDFLKNVALKCRKTSAEVKQKPFDYSKEKAKTTNADDNIAVGSEAVNNEGQNPKDFREIYEENSDSQGAIGLNGTTDAEQPLPEPHHPSTLLDDSKGNDVASPTDDVNTCEPVYQRVFQNNDSNNSLNENCMQDIELVPLRYSQEVIRHENVPQNELNAVIQESQGESENNGISAIDDHSRPNTQKPVHYQESRIVQTHESDSDVNYFSDSGSEPENHDPNKSQSYQNEPPSNSDSITFITNAVNDLAVNDTTVEVHGENEIREPSSLVQEQNSADLNQTKSSLVSISITSDCGNSRQNEVKHMSKSNDGDSSRSSEVENTESSDIEIVEGPDIIIASDREDISTAYETDKETGKLKLSKTLSSDSLAGSWKCKSEVDDAKSESPPMRNQIKMEKDIEVPFQSNSSISTGLIENSVEREDPPSLKLRLTLVNSETFIESPQEERVLKETDEQLLGECECLSNPIIKQEPNEDARIGGTDVLGANRQQDEDSFSSILENSDSFFHGNDIKYQIALSKKPSKKELRENTSESEESDSIEKSLKRYKKSNTVNITREISLNNSPIDTQRSTSKGNVPLEESPIVSLKSYSDSNNSIIMSPEKVSLNKRRSIIRKKRAKLLKDLTNIKTQDLSPSSPEGQSPVLESKSQARRKRLYEQFNETSQNPALSYKGIKSSVISLSGGLDENPDLKLSAVANRSWSFSSTSNNSDLLLKLKSPRVGTYKGSQSSSQNSTVNNEDNFAAKESDKEKDSHQKGKQLSIVTAFDKSPENINLEDFSVSFRDNGDKSEHEHGLSQMPIEQDNLENEDFELNKEIENLTNSTGLLEGKPEFLISDNNNNIDDKEAYELESNGQVFQEVSNVPLVYWERTTSMKQLLKNNSGEENDENDSISENIKKRMKEISQRLNQREGDNFEGDSIPSGQGKLSPRIKNFTKTNQLQHTSPKLQPERILKRPCKSNTDSESSLSSFEETSKQERKKNKVDTSLDKENQQLPENPEYQSADMFSSESIKTQSSKKNISFGLKNYVKSSTVCWKEISSSFTQPSSPEVELLKRRTFFMGNQPSAATLEGGGESYLASHVLERQNTPLEVHTSPMT